jgi:spore germination protein GerM
MKKIGILVLIFLVLISAETLADSYLEKANLMEIEIYFIRLNDETPEIEFIPIRYITPKGEIEKIIRSVIITLLQGLTKDEREKLNLETFIPEGTKLRKLEIDKDKGIVFIDFSKELQSYGGGSMNVICIRGQIERTVEQFPFVKQIIITVEGRSEEDGVLQP